MVAATFAGGIAFLAVGLGVALFGVEPAVQAFVMPVCAGLGFMFVSGSIRDWRLGATQLRRYRQQQAPEPP
jgi:hypothetical protein